MSVQQELWSTHGLIKHSWFSPSLDLFSSGLDLEAGYGFASVSILKGIGKGKESNRPINKAFIFLYLCGPKTPSVLLQKKNPS